MKQIKYEYTLNHLKMRHENFGLEEVKGKHNLTGLCVDGRRILIMFFK
jgi:hypothetical protein